MRILRLTLLLLFVTGAVISIRFAPVSSIPASEAQGTSRVQGFLGSRSCRECHERFYELWSSSHHGLAMQPYTPEFARKKLMSQREIIKIGEASYLAEIGPEQGWVKEISSDEQKTYPIAHAMGGKNVYYFLTPLDRGRLQALPIAYDVNENRWFDTAASGVRHLPAQSPEEPLHWKDPEYTFNTSCYSCHVSQISTNYDLKTDTYSTLWAEPGINCESCHGPASEHIRVCQQAPEGQVPKDLKIIITKQFRPEQTNALCAPCHAKASPLTAAFTPGDPYFDNFDLVTLEDEDFYPDGRDLGENYTYTSWRMSPCAKSGQLDCNHCHSPSGRNRFGQKQPNHACLPCHQQRVENAPAHTHHLPGSQGNQCISCHMPTTRFARMQRSDHSMRPPMPSATLAFKSPNACNHCHADKDAAWTDKSVREWWTRDYQAATLYWAGLVDAARKQDWSRLPDILKYLQSADREEVVVNSLIRLLRSCDDERKWPVILGASEDPSPLVRASVADTLGDALSLEFLPALIKATRDEYRLVRVRAAASLASLPPEKLEDQPRSSLEAATREFKEVMHARPDDMYSHYNLGNFYMDQRKLKQALLSYETAIRLRPDRVPPLVNISMVYNQLGQNTKAEQSLRRALAINPENVVANLNLGLLLAEMGKEKEAEESLRRVLKVDPKFAVAAYNLGILASRERPEETIAWCRKAYKLRPDEPKYAYTYAFYLNQSGKTKHAVEILQDMIDRQIPYADAYFMLGQLYEQQERPKDALRVYSAATSNEKLPEYQRRSFSLKTRQMQER